MKLVTKLIVASTLATFMFAGVGLTWGNSFSNNATDDLEAVHSFGVWIDVNESTAFGWENGLKVSLSGSGALAASNLRLGYGGGTSLGVGWNLDAGGGDGWSTTLGTAVDFQLTDAVADDGSQGTMSISVNLGFGF